MSAFATSAFSKVIVLEVEAFTLAKALSKPAKVGSYLDVILSQPKTIQHLTKFRGTAEIGRAESKIIEWTRQWAGRVERKTISNSFSNEYEPEKHFKSATRALFSAGLAAYSSARTAQQLVQPVKTIAIRKAIFFTKSAFAPSYTAKVLALYPLYASSPILPVFRPKA